MINKIISKTNTVLTLITSIYAVWKIMIEIFERHEEKYGKKKTS